MPLCSQCICHQQTLDQSEEQLLSTGSHSVEYGKDYESLDYDKCYNKPYSRMQQQLIKEQGKWHTTKKEILSWVTIFVIGFLTALVAFFIDSIIRLLTNLKYNTVSQVMTNCTHDDCVPVSLFTLIGFNVLFVAIAAGLVVFGEPLAAGSGIPEIKCYLNGIKVRNVARFRTLFCKSVGVLFSVSGGLFVGKEGPMIHSGGVIGAGIPQFQSLSFKALNLKIPYFRSDRDKRDFVSAGAAAGVAAAFGAPIGGVLFSLEEGCSYWSQTLTWKTLFCTMTSAFTLNFFLSGTLKKSWGTFSQNGLLTFGAFECPEENKNCHLWTAVDLFVFILIGYGGGLFGMLFNYINTKITVFRLKYLFRKAKIFRFLEAVLVGLVTSLVVFLSPLTVGTCMPIVGTMHNNSNTSYADGDLQTFLCPNGTYNDMATLFFNDQETAIKMLFHRTGEFSLLSLGIFFLLFFLVACWTYGSCVPSGLFVPCILCGAAYGRFVAAILNSISRSTKLFRRFAGFNHIYLGTFSLIGAAAFLGGVVRMTISLTVILIECTNEISLSLPIMVTLMVAKWAGDLGNDGLYDVHIHLKSVPLLEWDAPYYAVNYTAADIMNTRLSFVYPNTSIRSLVNLLSTTAHNAFPVVTRSPLAASFNRTISPPNGSSLASVNLRYRSSSHVSRMQIESERSHLDAREMVRVRGRIGDEKDEDARSSQSSLASLEDELGPLTLHGIVLRSHLVSLIKRNVGFSLREGSSAQKVISHEELNEDYPRFPSIHDIDLSAVDQTNIMDVTPYMHPCPHIVHPDSPVSQVFNLFRTMGLRHLPVINSAGELLGLITRHNLTHEFLENVRREQQGASSSST